MTVIDPGTRHWAVFSFVHDKWQVTPQITIDLGLRHEYYTPLVGLSLLLFFSISRQCTSTLAVV